MTTDHHALAPLPQSPAHWLHSYPAHLSQTWTLASGESLSVRPVRHDDDDLEEAFVRALSLESRYQRMLSGGTKVTPEWIESMTHIDYRHHMAFAVTTVSDGVEKFVGVGRYVVDASTLTADVALVLADAWQGRGLDRRLLANRRGTRGSGRCSCHQRGHAPARPSMGFAVTAEPGDATVMRIRRDLRTVNTQPH